MQCKWRDDGRCYAPAAPTKENPCMAIGEAKCQELEGTCIWGTAHTKGRYSCQLAPEDNLDDAKCNESLTEASCMAQPDSAQCSWIRGTTCIHAGCRNNEN